MREMFKRVLVTVAALGCVMGMIGCANVFSDSQAAETQAVSSTAASMTAPESRKTTAVYYDFEDVLIPVELSVVQDKTMIVSTPGFTSGILMLQGRVERRSLINFSTTTCLRTTGRWSAGSTHPTWLSWCLKSP